MSLVQNGEFHRGDSASDVAEYLDLYSADNGYRVHHTAPARCECGSSTFRLFLDDEEGAAVRACTRCGTEQPIADSADYLADARLEECECPCGKSAFEVLVGVSLHADSEDVRWLYVGCRCTACGIIGCYGDWKNEYIGYLELLARV